VLVIAWTIARGDETISLLKKTDMKLIPALSLAIVCIGLAYCNGNNSTTKVEEKSTTDTTSAEVAVNPLRNCYFGDLHLHTALSADANFFDTTLLPEDSYE